MQAAGAFASARSADGSASTGGVSGGTGTAWASRWDLAHFRANQPIDLTVWVAGEDYVTTQAHVTVQP